MNPWVIATYVLLWAITLALVVAVYGLYSHFGQIYLSSRQNRANQGPERGAPVARRELVGSEGDVVTVPSIGRRTVLVFTATSCDPCAELKPHLAAFAETDTEITVICAGTRDDVSRWSVDVPGVTIVPDIDRRITASFDVDFTPVGIGITRTGMAAGGGIVNDSHHLRALVDEIRSYESEVVVTGGPNV